MTQQENVDLPITVKSSVRILNLADTYGVSALDIVKKLAVSSLIIAQDGTLGNQRIYTRKDGEVDPFISSLETPWLEPKNNGFNPISAFMSLKDFIVKSWNAGQVEIDFRIARYRASIPHELMEIINGLSNEYDRKPKDIFNFLINDALDLHDKHRSGEEIFIINEYGDEETVSFAFGLNSQESDESEL